MLPKLWRLIKEKDIKDTYYSKLRSNSKYSQIYLKKSKLTNFELLVVVSKKIYKKANKRNRIKRKIYAIFEELKTQDRLPSSVACIIQVKNKNILFQQKEEIKTDILPNVSILYKKLITKVHTARN